MSAVCILTPVVIAAWPTFSTAVFAAASALGYEITGELSREVSAPVQTRGVQLEIPQSELVTNQLDRNRQIVVTRNGVAVKFARDARGRASVCVTGPGHADAELRALGEELSQRVVQQYAYQRLVDEARAQGFVIVEDSVDAEQAIHLKLRHWEN